MTRVHLVRHAANDLVGHTIAGWKPGVHLNDLGREQANRLAACFAKGSLQRIFSSPLERAQETAAALARAGELPVETVAALGEIQFGEWTGRRFDALAMDPQWQQWNEFRSGARPPGGETTLQAQARMVGFVQQLCDDLPGASVALVSHGDPIRSVLLYYLGMPIDLVHRLEVGPASVSTLEIGDRGARLLALNWTPDPP